MPARIEKSSKSPSFSICAAGRCPARATGTAAPRSERRDPDRAAAPTRVGGRCRGRRRRASSARARRRMSGLGMRQQRPQRRVPALASAALRAGRARSGPPTGSLAASLSPQRVGRRTLEHRRRRPLRIEAMAMDAVLNGADVRRPQPPRDDDPHGDQHQVDRRRAAQIEPEAGEHEEPVRQQPKTTAPTASATRLTTMSMAFLTDARSWAERQIQELVGRLVDREPEPLIEGVGDEHRPERRRQHDQGGAERRAPAAAPGSSPPARTGAAPGSVSEQLHAGS